MASPKRKPKTKRRSASPRRYDPLKSLRNHLHDLQFEQWKGGAIEAKVGSSFTHYATKGTGLLTGTLAQQKYVGSLALQVARETPMHWTLVVHIHCNDGTTIYNEHGEIPMPVTALGSPDMDEAYRTVFMELADSVNQKHVKAYGWVARPTSARNDRAICIHEQNMAEWTQILEGKAA